MLRLMFGLNNDDATSTTSRHKSHIHSNTGATTRRWLRLSTVHATLLCAVLQLTYRGNECSNQRSYSIRSILDTTPEMQIAQPNQLQRAVFSLRITTDPLSASFCSPKNKTHIEPDNIVTTNPAPGLFIKGRHSSAYGPHPLSNSSFRTTQCN